MAMDRNVARKKSRSDQMREEIADLYIRGKRQWEIAQRFGISQPMVSRHLDAIRQQWRASAVRDFDAARERELQKLDALEREYWTAWEASRNPARTNTTETTSEPGPPPTAAPDAQPEAEPSKPVDRPTKIKRGRKREHRDGNPAFLSGVERCIQQRCKLLGLIVDKAELTGKDGGPLEIEGPVDLKKLTDGRLEELAAIIAETQTADAPGGPVGEVPA